MTPPDVLDTGTQGSLVVWAGTTTSPRPINVDFVDGADVVGLSVSVTEAERMIAHLTGAIAEVRGRT